MATNSTPKSHEIKLASLVVHVEELLDSMAVHDGVAVSFDQQAIRGLLADYEVRQFMTAIPAVFLPVKRSAK